MSELIFSIRSKDCTNLTSGFNSHILVNVPVAINIPEYMHLHCKVVSAEIPYSFYCVSDNLDNTKLVWDTSNSATIAEQNYDVDTLKDTLNAIAESPFTWTFDEGANQFSVKNTDGSSHTINFASSDLHKVVGNKSQDEIIAAGVTHVLDGVVDLATVHGIHVRMPGLNSANVFTTTTANSNLVQKIPIRCNTLGIIYHDSLNYTTNTIIKSGSIKQFEIMLTDQNTNLIQMNNVNWELTMTFMLMKDSDMIQFTVGEEGVDEKTTSPIEPPIETVQDAVEPLVHTAHDVVVENLLERLKVESGL